MGIPSPHGTVSTSCATTFSAMENAIVHYNDGGDGISQTRKCADRLVDGLLSRPRNCVVVGKDVCVETEKEALLGSLAETDSYSPAFARMNTWPETTFDVFNSVLS
jgi:hypothetical protein